MKEEDTLCYQLRELNKVVENHLKDRPLVLLQIKSLLNEATYKANKMDIKLWEYKLNDN